MNPEQRRARYLAGTDGAPPVPPPGGYRGARRWSHSPENTEVETRTTSFTEATETETTRPNALGWSALSVASGFAVVLFGTLLVGSADLLYSITMFALQAVVIAVVAAALFSKRGRRLGSIAVIITLLCNVATVGGVGALQTSASGNYKGTKTEQQKHAAAYPGIKGLEPDEALTQRSLEEVRADTNKLFEDIRTRITAEFGYEWVQIDSEDQRPERNGYGGESMLVEYTSVSWATAEPIRDYERKLAVMDVIDSVVAEHKMLYLYSFSDEHSSMDPSLIEKFFGSVDPRRQHTWAYAANGYGEEVTFYADIFDLSQDPTGDLRATRKAQNAKTGEPLEGLRIFVNAKALLREGDRSAYESKLSEYPDY